MPMVLDALASYECDLVGQVAEEELGDADDRLGEGAQAHHV